jgi:predicted dehydrogenase
MIGLKTNTNCLYMKEHYDRRIFIKIAAVTGAGLTLSGSLSPLYAQDLQVKGKRVGIIGLDTSHALAFVKTLNAENAAAEYRGYKVVAAYPQGSKDIKSSVDRVPGYVVSVKKMGVEIVDSIAALLEKVDVVLLESNDGRVHLEQALPIFKAGKRLFIDKPIAGSYADAKAIFKAAKKYNVPVFSSSSLRYIEGMSEITAGKIGKVIGAQTYSPAVAEKTHPDFFWYGIHGIELLFAAMGTGCKSVSRVHTEDTDVVIGIWEDNRIGTFRGTRSGQNNFGGIVFGEKATVTLGAFKGYNPLLLQIIKFFESGMVPVQPEETLEICAFMEAADISKATDGSAVSLKEISQKG